MRAMLMAALAVVAGGRAMAQDHLPDARPFADYLQSQYTPQEHRCSTVANVQAGWCFTTAAKRRDAATAKLLQDGTPAMRSYHAAWLKLRAEHCNAAGSGGGSGSGTIEAECMLDMAIAHQFELGLVLN